MLLVLSFFQAGTSQPSKPAPTQIILNQPFGWITPVVSFIQFVLLALLTFYIFRRNYRQKEMERQAEWYHRLVMEFAVVEVTKFFSEGAINLAAVAGKVDRLKASGAQRAAMDEMLVAELSSFKELLFNLSRVLGGRLSVFNRELEQCSAKKFQDLEDSVSHWFEKEAEAKPGESRIGIAQVLSDSQSDLLKTLRDYEFSEFT